MKAHWREFRRLPAGERFQIRYREQQRSRADKPTWKRVLPLLLVPVLLAAGVVLMFIPGPAVLFFFLAGALIASHSLRVARAFDWAEVKLRNLAKTLQAWWRRRSVLRTKTNVVVLLLVVFGVSSAAVLELFVWS